MPFSNNDQFSRTTSAVSMHVGRPRKQSQKTKYATNGARLKIPGFYGGLSNMPSNRFTRSMAPITCSLSKGHPLASSFVKKLFHPSQQKGHTPSLYDLAQ